MESICWGLPAAAWPRLCAYSFIPSPTEGCGWIPRDGTSIPMLPLRAAPLRRAAPSRAPALSADGDCWGPAPPCLASHAVSASCAAAGRALLFYFASSLGMRCPRSRRILWLLSFADGFLLPRSGRAASGLGDGQGVMLASLPVGQRGRAGRLAARLAREGHRFSSRLVAVRGPSCRS